MDKDTKMELLKILGMIIILVVLIWGIVWMNTDHTSTKPENNVVSNESEVVDGENENATEENTNSNETNTSKE